MPAADDSPHGVVYDPLDQVRHDLKTPLTTISGHAQLLGRAVRRSPSLSNEERAKMLEGLAMIEAAVGAMVTIIDAMSRNSADGSPDSTG
jgi:signal transduction histidine kinase